VNGEENSEMVKANKNGKMGQYTMENGAGIRSMGRESIHFHQEMFMKV
jgi:hypothetical protein